MFFLGDVLNKKIKMPAASEALPGRDRPVPTATDHFVSRRPLHGPYPEGLETAWFGMGCFWGAERLFWQTEGVWVTAVGYAGGLTPNPTYQETCTGLTGHAEVVMVVYDPKIVSFQDLLKIFWESHDPTQGMRQGNDVGTQYRSGIYVTNDEQQAVAEQARKVYGEKLAELGYGAITTEIAPLGEFYYAEDYHQQYLAKNLNGYRCHATTGIKFPRAAI